MTLVSGDLLKPESFFKGGQPAPQGSSFDLTIGCIFDHDGKKVEGPFTIKPGHMVQVVSSEVFSLTDRVTGHVTYKTTLTKKGIWALTVGIVDPGWDGPVATTLLNFSKVDHAIARGDAFLRVSFFEHAPVPADRLRKAPPSEAYLMEIQKTAASMFPPTFLNSDKIVEAAGSNVLNRIRIEALVWVASIVLIFTVVQLVFTFGRAYMPSEIRQADFDALHRAMSAIETRLLKFEQMSSHVAGPTPTVPTILSPTPNPPQSAVPAASSPRP